MKQYFIEQRHLPSLTLFFAGWGMDERPFLHYHPADRDLLVCYDYRSLDFDFSLPEGYEDIRGRLVDGSVGRFPSFGPFLSSHYRKCGGERDNDPCR